ncbi:hypothetical protein ACIBCN_19315 [Nocardia sp. NPDC051052]|uniref:hypothetical protein n=1 Tax=Nocardia sp. NPDC051052 TaxID=3364322 RepID=UPI00379E5E68
MQITTPWLAVAMSPWLALPLAVVVSVAVIVLVTIILTKKQTGDNATIKLLWAKIDITNTPVNQDGQKQDAIKVSPNKDTRPHKRSRRLCDRRVPPSAQ